MMNLQKTDKSGRMSTVGYNRNMTMGVTKEKDPRPIADKNFQESSCKKIINYLISHNYENEISTKLLMNLTQKDFIGIFNFLLFRLRPDYSFVLKKIDDDVPKILTDIKYPFNIPKHCLISFGTNTSLAPIFAMFLWIVELLLALEDTDIEEESTDKTNEFEKFEEDYLKACFEEYQRTGEKEHFDLTEKFNQNAAKLREINDKKISELQKEIELVDEKIYQLKNSAPELDTLRKHKENMLYDNEVITNKIESNEGLIVIKNNETKMKTQCLEAKNEKLNELKKVLDESEKTHSEQIISFEEYEILKVSVDKNDKLITFYQNKKKELSEIQLNQSNEIEEILETIKEKRKLISNINEKIKSILYINDSESLYFLNFEKNIERYIEMINDFFFDNEKIKEEFSVVFKEIEEKNEILSKSLREMEEEYLKLKTELLLLEDRITEKCQLLRKKFEYREDLIESHKLKKEKLCNDEKELSESNTKYKIEIEKLLISNDQKRKEHEAFRRKENELNNLNIQKEEELNKFIIEIENELKETIEEVCKYKSDYYKTIRRAGKIFQTIEQKWMSDQK
jgi:SMC interacting uncharacterized protein involved in chromosome segregation